MPSRTSSVTALDEAAAVGADVAGLTLWLARIGLVKHEASVIPKLVGAGVLTVEELEELKESSVAELGLPVFERQKLADALKEQAAMRRTRESDRKSKAEAERSGKEEADRKAKDANTEAAKRAKTEEHVRNTASIAKQAVLSGKALQYLKRMDNAKTGTTPQWKGVTYLDLGIPGVLVWTYFLTVGFSFVVPIFVFMKNKGSIWNWPFAMGDDNVLALAEALKANTTLKRLDINHRMLFDSGAIAVAEALKGNKSLTFLNMTCNCIGPAGMHGLADALKVNTSLKWIDLRDNLRDGGGAAKVKDAARAGCTVLVAPASPFDDCGTGCCCPVVAQV